VSRGGLYVFYDHLSVCRCAGTDADFREIYFLAVEILLEVYFCKFVIFVKASVCRVNYLRAQPANLMDSAVAVLGF